METHPPNESSLRPPIRVSFDAKTGHVVLQLSKVDFGFIDRPVTYQGQVFQPKSELHITLVSNNAAAAIRQHLENNPDAAADFEDLINSTNWSYRKQGELYMAEEQPGVASIVQMVDVPMLDDFYRRLSQQLGKGVLLPPTHVTLYVRGTEKGIGLPDMETFRKLVKTTIKPEELQALDNRSAPGVQPGQAH